MSRIIHLKHYPMIYLVLVLFFGGNIQVYGNVRLVCPMPHQPASDLTQAPCGNGIPTADFKTNYLEVSPGPLTIRWEETSPLIGSPSRIALRSRSSGTSCILLDHIPNSPRQNQFNSPDCTVKSPPIGTCNASTNYLTVDIPDLSCDDCYLQLMTVNTDQHPDQLCKELADGSVNCTTYYSCAYIRIQATVQGRARRFGSCQQLANINKNREWPYTQADLYAVHNIDIPGLGPDTYIHFYARDGATPNTAQLSYDIHLDVNSQFFRLDTASDSITLHEMDMQSGYFGGTVIIIQLTGLQVQESLGNSMTLLLTALKERRLGIRINLSYQPNVRSDYAVSFVETRYVRGSWGSHVEPFTRDGWLKDSAFINNVPASFFITPVGPCAPRTIRYGALITDLQLNPRVFLFITSFGEYTHLTALFVGSVPVSKMELISATSLSTPVPSGWLQLQNPIQGVLVSAPVPTTSVQVQIGTDLFENAVARSSMVFVEKEQLKMMAQMVTTTQGLRVAVMVVRGMQPQTMLRSTGEVNYPTLFGASLGLHTTVPLKEDVRNNAGGYIANALLPVTDSVLPLMLALGEISVIVNSEQHPMKEKFREKDMWICANQDASPACRVTRLSLGQNNGAPGSHNFSPLRGVAAFFINDTVFSVSIAVRELRFGKKITGASVFYGPTLLGQYKDVDFQQAVMADKLYVAHANMQVSAQIRQAVNTPPIGMRFVVRTTDGELTGQYGNGGPDTSTLAGPTQWTTWISPSESPTKPGTFPGSQPGTQTESQPGTQSGTQSGTQPGASYQGTSTGQTGQQSAFGTGQQTESTGSVNTLSGTFPIASNPSQTTDPNSGLCAVHAGMAILVMPVLLLAHLS